MPGLTPRDASSEPLMARQEFSASRVLLLAAMIYQPLLAYTVGIYDHTALLLCIPVLVLLLGAALVPVSRRRALSREPLIALAAISIIVQLTVILSRRVSDYFVPPSSDHIRVFVGLTVALGCIGSATLCRQSWVGTRALLLLGLIHGVLGCFVVANSPTPRIDVHVFHQDSGAAVLAGKNPYSITFPNIYHNPNGDVDERFYSRKVQVGDRLSFGFPYPPASLLLYLPSYLLTGESRFAHAIAWTVATVLIGTIHSSRLTKAAAILLMTAPAAWHVIGAAWTEPFLVLALVVLARVALKRPAWTAVALGVFFALKQYTVIFLPLVFLLLPRPLRWRSSLRFIVVAAATAAVVTLPLALWNWKAFWYSTITIQLQQPFRPDALSFLALFARMQPNGLAPPQWWSAIAFLLLLPTWALLLWRLKPGIANFVIAVTVTMAIFLFFNRQAFLNYHSFVAAAALLSMALLEQRSDAAMDEAHTTREAAGSESKPV